MMNLFLGLDSRKRNYQYNCIDMILELHTYHQALDHQKGDREHLRTIEPYCCSSTMTWPVSK
ncbi:hypothetical protein Hanom_Chr12g01113431 [Helianthus anomalus]